MVHVKKKRLVNPETRKFGSPRAARSRPKAANPGQIFLLGAVNPQKGQTTVKKSKKKNYKKPARRPTSNPWPFAKKAKAKGWRLKKRHNPEFLEGGLRQPIDVVKFGILAALGFYTTRQVPQWVLNTKNQGIIGYLANLATAIAAGAGTRWGVSKQAGNAVMIGGGLYLVNRVAVEQFAPVGNMLKLAGVGDATATTNLGKIRDAYFPVPVIHDKNGNPIIPKEIDAASVRALIAQQPKSTGAAVSGVSRASAVSRRMQGRLAA
jgi:hypothetical protein